MAQYQTIGGILHDKSELFPEIADPAASTTLADPHLVLSAAMDYILGRGVMDADLTWLGALCNVLSRELKGCNPSKIVDGLMSGEDESGFSENWQGEVGVDDIERVKASIHERSM